MSKFKLNDFTVNQEGSNASQVRIVKLDGGTAPSVRNFEFNTLQKSGDGDYLSVKAKYGPIAPTDVERRNRTQKDRRFSLNPLIRDSLSIEQEEERIIEDKVKDKITEIAERAKAEAMEEGYKEGLLRGHDEATQAVRKEGAQNLARLDQLVEDLESAKNEIFKANERFLIELIFKIARMVILKDLSTDRSYLERLTKELVNRVGVKDHITIKVNPEVGESIEMLKDSLEKAFGQLTNLTIEVSAQVDQRGCRIETEWNAIDATIDGQLEGIRQSLVGNPGSSPS